VTPPFKAGCRALKTVYNGGAMVAWCIRTTESRTLAGVYKHGFFRLAEVTRGIVQILFTISNHSPYTIALLYSTITIALQLCY
jgi:hypothetical protein